MTSLARSSATTDRPIARCGRWLSKSQLQALQVIAQCRTEALGGHVYSCPSCQITRYSYHSCRIHVKPLGDLFRAKFRVGLRQTLWASQVDARAWAKPWVVDCRPVGSGLSALKYLAPYIFRIALSNNRIEQVANEMVTFRYTEGKTGVHKRATLGIDTFIGRFLAHVLPKGFVKVRSYGLLHPSKRQLLAELRSILALQQTAPS